MDGVRNLQKTKHGLIKLASSSYFPSAAPNVKDATKYVTSSRVSTIGCYARNENWGVSLHCLVGLDDVHWSCSSDEGNKRRAKSERKREKDSKERFFLLNESESKANLQVAASCCNALLTIHLIVCVLCSVLLCSVLSPEALLSSEIWF